MIPLQPEPMDIIKDEAPPQSFMPNTTALPLHEPTSLVSLPPPKAGAGGLCVDASEATCLVDPVDSEPGPKRRRLLGDVPEQQVPFEGEHLGGVSEAEMERPSGDPQKASGRFT